MILSKYNLKNIQVPGLQMPGPEIFNLPEKVLQFGTGVLLRGLPDYYIDKANRNGVFNGRIVVVKSTSKGSTDDFGKQDGLYTIYARGVENLQEVNEEVICSAISRVISATEDWTSILEVARSPELKVIISNTTEVGIQFVKEDVRKQPPESYPGKLLAVLYERFKAFNGSPSSGLVIIPTELIVDNGLKLESIIFELSHLNNLEHEFMDWLEDHNSFCNSLVDRIVPGQPDKSSLEQLENDRGYTDNLHIMAETYSLWAIEGDEKVKNILSFSKANKEVVITPDIKLFRELKLRLLNGSHTLSCAVAILSGFKTVQQAMNNAGFSRFISELAHNEIIYSIPYQIEHYIASEFAGSVLDRFRNPYIKHEWFSIAVNYSAKIKMRVLPLLLNHYKTHGTVPPNMALGLAAFIRFMDVTQRDDGTFGGMLHALPYTVDDSEAAFFAKAWELPDIDATVENILGNKELWDADLNALPGFKDAVTGDLKKIMSGGINNLISA